MNLTEVQGLGSLESLEYLNMNDQAHIVRLSELSKLRWLRNLEISSCLKLIEIQGLGGLESLELLDMSRCRSIKSILGLSNLKRLKKKYLMARQASQDSRPRWVGILRNFRYVFLPIPRKITGFV